MTQTYTYHVDDFGAKGDGCTNNSNSFQAAIDHCHANGGGTVYVPPGTYLAGVFFLKSHVNLHLEHGAKITGSHRLEDYEVEGTRYGMIVAKNCEHVSISGGGILDANGDAFMHLDRKTVVKEGDFTFDMTRQGDRFGQLDEHGDPDGAVCHGERPFQMLIFTACKHITVNDITIKNAPCWTLHIHDSENVNVSGIRILNNPLVPNNDGINTTCSRNIHISDCHIESGDDAIAITGFNWHEGFPGFNGTSTHCENVTVTNCTLVSRSAGIRLGAGKNDVRNVLINNVVIRDSNRGLIIWVRDGNTVSDVICSNIRIETRYHTGCWWGKSEPIALSVMSRHADTALGIINNITFSNIHAKSNSGIVMYSPLAGAISGITLHQFRLRLCSHLNRMAVGGNFDLRPTWSLDEAVFKHDIAGIFAKNITNLDINGFQYHPDVDLDDYYIHAVWLDGYEDTYLRNIRAYYDINDRDELLKLENGNINSDHAIIVENCHIVSSKNDFSEATANS